MQTFNVARDLAILIDMHGSIGAAQTKLGRSTGAAHLNVVPPEGRQHWPRIRKLRDLDGDVERLVELQSQGGRWGVVSVTSCTGFG